MSNTARAADIEIMAAARKLWRSREWFGSYTRGFEPFEEYLGLRDTIMEKPNGGDPHEVAVAARMLVHSEGWTRAKRYGFVPMPEGHDLERAVLEGGW